MMEGRHSRHAARAALGRFALVAGLIAGSACSGGDDGAGDEGEDEGSGGAGRVGASGGATSSSGGTTGAEYSIDLASDLGGAEGGCRLNWCRGGTCHMICPLVPDDEASCDAAAEAYAGVPGQNFLDVEFMEGRTCEQWSTGNVKCLDEFGVVYAPIRDECNDGDAIAATDGACHVSFCATGNSCFDDCIRTDEAGCDERDRILRQADGRVSSSTRYEPTGTCPTSGGGSGGASGSGGSSGRGGSSSDARCSECLSSCSGLASCCTGTGCLCAEACQPTGCTPPRVLCCRTSPCLCLENC